MPGYRGHLIGGGLVYYGTVYFLMQGYSPDLFTLAQGLIFCLIGALFPDIDIKSMGQKYFFIMLAIVLLFCLIYQKSAWFIALTFLSIIPLLARHRGFFHSLFFISALSFFLIVCALKFNLAKAPFAVSNALFFMIGAWSHILLDRFFTQIKKMFGIKRK